MLQPVDDREAELASEIEQVKPKDAEYTIPIAGNVAQLDVLASQQPCGLSSQQLVRIIALAVDTAHRHTRIPSARLQVRAIKLLTARAGQGEQLIHFDHHDGFLTKGRFSYLLYLTEGSQSTAMWRHPLALLPQNDSTVAMKAAYAQLFDKQQYHTVRVHRGQSMFFDERAPHFGSKTHKLRRVLFVQLAGRFHWEKQKLRCFTYQRQSHPLMFFFLLVRCADVCEGRKDDEKQDAAAAETNGEDVESDGYQYYEWQVRNEQLISRHPQRDGGAHVHSSLLCAVCIA